MAVSNGWAYSWRRAGLWMGVGVGVGVGIVLGAADRAGGQTVPVPASAVPTLPTGDPVVRRIWDEGMTRSGVEGLAQVLMDVIGPRLTGTPGQRAASDWAVAQYAGWGIPARNEAYGTWRGWRRGVTHVDLVAPRVRTLEGTLLAWSPGTGGRDVTAAVLALPAGGDSAAFTAWLPQARGRFVLVAMPQPTCRPDDNWKQFATPESFAAMQHSRGAAAAEWAGRVRAAGDSGGVSRLVPRLEGAGVAGIVTSHWSEGWGTEKVMEAETGRVPEVEVSCEDYGLVSRLAAHGQGPVLRVRGESELQGAVPVANTLAQLTGSEKPEEYVVLSAHLDSYDGGSGATDNGTGAVTMLEAMRILKAVDPHPKRTILAALWVGEEQGRIGSRTFMEDHPDMVRNFRVLFNQDNGTGRIAMISMQGLTEAGSAFARWLSRLPTELSDSIRLQVPGTPAAGGSDYASFLCSGAPAFSLSSVEWGYRNYTWHTNRDTFDKIVFDDLKSNATLMAMLAYLAAEDPAPVPRDRRVFVPDSTGRTPAWPACKPGVHAWSASIH